MEKIRGLMGGAGFWQLWRKLTLVTVLIQTLFLPGRQGGAAGGELSKHLAVVSALPYAVVEVQIGALREGIGSCELGGRRGRRDRGQEGGGDYV
jgi:hypothetical protein